MRRTLLLAALVVAVLAIPTTASAKIGFGVIQFDSPGNDTGTNKSLNGETIEVKNYGDKPKWLTGWTVKVGKRIYAFPTFKLNENQSVWIHTGKGEDTWHHVYWGRRAYVMPNDEGSLTLRSTDPVRIKDTCTYTDFGNPDGDTSC